MLKPQTKSKSPFALLLLITVLIISTLVVVSNYFFRPGLELDLKNRVKLTLYSHKIFNASVDVNGRDVVLNGITTDSIEAEKIETEIQNLTGVNRLHSQLVISTDINAKD